MTKRQFIVTVEGSWTDGGKEVTSAGVAADLRLAVKRQFQYLAKRTSVRCPLAAETLPPELTWLYTHCRAIGMDCKSDSGKWEHDIALFTSNLQEEVKRLTALLNTPETLDFIKGLQLETAHQRERWATSHDAGKAPADWFWLIGYLAQKAMMSHLAGDTGKALHHTITTAAALANWHAAILGKNDMRPGIAPPTPNKENP